MSAHSGKKHIEGFPTTVTHWFYEWKWQTRDDGKNRRRVKVKREFGKGERVQISARKKGGITAKNRCKRQKRFLLVCSFSSDSLSCVGNRHHVQKLEEGCNQWVHQDKTLWEHSLEYEPCKGFNWADSSKKSSRATHHFTSSTNNLW